MARDEGFLGSDAPTVATWAEGTLNVEHTDAGELLDTKRKLRRFAVCWISDISAARVW